MGGDLPDYTKFIFPQIARYGRPKIYDTTVAVAGTENTHDVNDDLGKNGRDGYIVCDGAGNLKIRISDDGTNFNGGSGTGSTEEITLEEDEVFRLEGLNIDTIKVDATVNGTAYRIVVVG